MTATHLVLVWAIHFSTFSLWMFARKRVVLICNAVYDTVPFWFPQVPASCSHLPYSPRCGRPSSSSGERSTPHDTEPNRRGRRRNTIDAWNFGTNCSHTEKNRGIKQWFVIACSKENRNMFVLPLCTGSVTTAAALLSEWHLCHVAACLQHRLSSTEEKLFLCLRDSYSTHTLGHWPMGVCICYVCVCVCVCVRVFVLHIMSPLDVAELKPVMVCVCFWYPEQGAI